MTFHNSSIIPLQLHQTILMKSIFKTFQFIFHKTLQFQFHFYNTLQIQHQNKWNIFIRHESANNPLKALSLFQEMHNQKHHFHNDPFVYASLIKACCKARSFLQGKSIHSHVIRTGLVHNANISNSLVCFYMGFANSTNYAISLFDMIVEKTVVTVNCMISGHVRSGNLDVGFDLFLEMLRGCFGPRVRPNYVTLVILFSICTKVGGIRTATVLHCYCWKLGCIGYVEISNVLIDLYSKLGCVFDAAIVFENMDERDSISWNAMIWGYANYGDGKQGFSLFRKMRFEDVGLDKMTFSCLVSVCASRKDLLLGSMVHAHVKKFGIESDVSVGTSLIHMYAKCSEVKTARDLFDELPKQCIEFWNSMIHAYTENGLAREALNLYDQIKLRKLEPDEVTILGFIKACRETGELGRGIHFHSIVDSKEPYKRSIVLRNALIDMYAKCGNMEYARAVFDKMPEKDVISWTSIIVGHAVNGEGDKSLSVFKQMCEEKIVPNPVTFIGVLSACDHAGLVTDGRKLFDTMCKGYNIKPQIEHFGCMVDMLARAGKLNEAQMFIEKMGVEPNRLVWRMLINACRVHNDVNLGLTLMNGVKGLNDSLDSEDHVISSNMFAEAGKWGEVVSHRNSLVLKKVPKVAGMSYVS